jgi:hypothetical protein
MSAMLATYVLAVDFLEVLQLVIKIKKAKSV